MISELYDICIMHILEGGMQSNGNRRPSVVLINIPCCPAVAVTDSVSTFRFGNPTVPNFSKIFRWSVCGCAIAIDYQRASSIEKSFASQRLCCSPKSLISCQLVVFQSEDAAAAAGNDDILQPRVIEIVFLQPLSDEMTLSLTSLQRWPSSLQLSLTAMSVCLSLFNCLIKAFKCRKPNSSTPLNLADRKSVV